MSSVTLTSDSLASPAVAGTIEYTSPALFATPIGTQRGIIPTAQFYRLNSGLVGADSTSAQNMLGVGVTLSSSTVYAFEAVFAFSKSAGTTNHSISFGFGGTATLNNINYSAIQKTNNSTFVNLATTDTTQLFVQTASATAITGSSTSATITFVMNIKGNVSVNAGGTFIPQYTLTAAPGGAYTTAAGSYFLIYPIGASGTNTSIGTWA